jgi:hypothetical protein
MRFRRWPRPTPYEDTSRKRAAFFRKQRLEREALPLFADHIAAQQHDVEDEMRHRAERWSVSQQASRDQRATSWRAARQRLFVLDDDLRHLIRDIWRGCPYPADPSYFADLLHQIEVGRLDPHRPPWIFQRSFRGSGVCPADYDPVCDNKTYSNECNPAFAEVSKSHDGECSSTRNKR